MILIISEDTDISTDNVIKWIIKYGGMFFRINYSDSIENILKKENGQIFLTSKGVTISLNDITCFWHRRADLTYKKYEMHQESIYEKREHLYMEWIATKEYLFYKLFEKPHIANINPNLNKLIVLEEAEKIGLRTPPFILCDKRTSIFDNNITKTISNVYTVHYQESIETIYTENFEKFKNDDFFLSLVQQKIETKYEVRTVFVKGCCWSMAIHNFNDEVDYRKSYDDGLRYSPYKLPNKVETKFIQLCKKLQLDFGVADFIVDMNNEYYLLEINPSGQYGMVSDPCNYPIDEEIAKILIGYEKRKI